MPERDASPRRGVSDPTTRPTLMTVLGPIAAEDMGRTLIHEHVFLDFRRHAVLATEGSGPPIELSDDPIELNNLGHLQRNPFSLAENLMMSDVLVATDEFLAFKNAGGGTIVDLTNGDLSRDPPKLVEVARATGVHVVMGCGHYVAAYHPPHLEDMSVEQIEEEMLIELTEGVGDTGVRAGVIGELGASPPITAGERKVLTAAARASERTNTAISIHVHPWGSKGPVGYETVRVLERAGADLSRVVLSHLDSQMDMHYHEALLRTGVNIGYDHFGKEYHSDASHLQRPTDFERLQGLAQLIERGHIDQLVISHDVCFKMDLRAYGRWGYSHILEHIVPMARSLGISEAEMEILLVNNPARILTGG